MLPCSKLGGRHSPKFEFPQLNEAWDRRENRRRPTDVDERALGVSCTVAGRRRIDNSERSKLPVAELNLPQDRVHGVIWSASAETMNAGAAPLVADIPPKPNLVGVMNVPTASENILIQEPFSIE